MLSTSEKIIKHKVGLVKSGRRAWATSPGPARSWACPGTHSTATNPPSTTAAWRRLLETHAPSPPNLAEQGGRSHREAQSPHSRSSSRPTVRCVTSNELRKTGCLCLSPSGVRSIWLRQRSGELQAAPEGSGSQSRRDRNDPDRKPGSGAGEEKARR